MKGVLITGFLAMLATPAASIAQTSFNGTWKVDFNSAMPKKVNVWLLQNGTYKCSSCSPIFPGGGATIGSTGAPSVRSDIPATTIHPGSASTI